MLDVEGGGRSWSGFQSHRLQSALNAMTRYAEDLEGERDEARDEVRGAPLSALCAPPPLSLLLVSLIDIRLTTMIVIIYTCNYTNNEYH